MPELTFSYKINKSDFVKTMRAFYFHNKATIAVLLFMTLLSIYFIANALITSTTSMFTFFFPIMVILYFLFLFFLTPISMGTSVEKNERLSAETTWEVNDNGVSLRNQFSSASFDWGTFGSVFETDEHFLMTYQANKNAFQIVPKRAFQTKEEEAQFRKFLEEKLQRIVPIRSVNLPVLSKGAVIGVVVVILLLAMVVVAGINFMQQSSGR